MKDNFHIKRAEGLKNFTIIKQYYCYDSDCVLVCCHTQKKNCLDRFWEIALDDDEYKLFKMEKLK